MQQVKGRKQSLPGSFPSNHQASSRRSNVHHYITTDKDVNKSKLKKNGEYIDTNHASGGCFDDDDNCLSPTAWIYDGFTRLGLGKFILYLDNFFIINYIFYILSNRITTKNKGNQRKGAMENRINSNSHYNK
jgi:hypothetical protein